MRSELAHFPAGDLGEKNETTQLKMKLGHMEVL